MIKPKDISVVVQGPIQHQGDLTKRVLESVRAHLPEAELILSTWKGSDVSGLEYDILLLNDDPGAINGNNNVNRQIVSTRNGLQKASRSYAMKLRTDTLLTGTGFLSTFEQYPERRDDFKVFEKKIVIPTVYTRNPLRLSPYSPNAHFFHPSDIFQFGLKSDLVLLWNLSLIFEKGWVFPEQYIWISCLKSFFQDIDFLNLTLQERLKVSEISLFNNYVIETPKGLCVKFPSRLLEKRVSTCYTVSEFHQLYSRYIREQNNTLPLLTLFRLGIISLLISLKGLNLNFGLRRLIQQFYNKSSIEVN